jgi:hypothetical protein
MYTAKRVTRVGVGVAAAALLIVSVAAPARATSYANRSLNLPNGVMELGLGLGVGHLDPIDYTGLGVNMELGYGLNSRLELRFRTGIRFGQEGRTTDADYFGRPVNTETRHLGGDTLANPDLGLRFSVQRGGTAEVALDAHLIIPVDGKVGLMFGVPLALHLDRIRIDTGIFIPIVFVEDNTVVDISIPLHLWIRLDSGTFLGPMTGIYFHDGGGESVPFGVGAGTPLAYDADLRFWFLFPDIDNASDWFGVGVGLYVTF